MSLWGPLRYQIEKWLKVDLFDAIPPAEKTRSPSDPILIRQPQFRE